MPIKCRHVTGAQSVGAVAILTLVPVGHGEPLKVLEEGSSLKKGQSLEKCQECTSWALYDC